MLCPLSLAQSSPWRVQGQRHTSPFIHGHIGSRCGGFSTHKYFPRVRVWVFLLPSLRYSVYCLGPHPSLVQGACETLRQPLALCRMPLPTLPCSLLLCLTDIPKKLDCTHGSSESLGPGYSGHTHPWMQCAADTTQPPSMRAPPHTCSFSMRTLASQGQWRIDSNLSSHQGVPQTSAHALQREQHPQRGKQER